MSKPSKSELNLLTNSYHDVKKLISNYDQVAYFKDLWGDNYYKNIEDSWENHISKFKNDEDITVNWRELVLVITFDYYLGPYVGLPEKVKLKFYNWIITEIINQCDL